MRYLKPTRANVAEYRAANKHRSQNVVDKEVRCLRLKSGDKEATRLVREKDGTINICAPWLLSDMFSL